MHSVIGVFEAAATVLLMFSGFLTFSAWMNGQETTSILINMDRNCPPTSHSFKTTMTKSVSRVQLMGCWEELVLLQK